MSHLLWGIAVYSKSAVVTIIHVGVFVDANGVGANDVGARMWRGLILACT